MAYIDREQVCENCNNKNYCEKEKCPVYKVSTADVVPKSEVEELIRENESLAKTVNEASELIRKLRSKVKKSKSDVAREIFAEIEAIIDNNSYKSYLPNSSLWSKEYKIKQIITELAELKKKYTEEKE